MTDTLIVRYSEITLKGKNRHLFEKQMAENIRRHLKAYGPYPVEKQHARVLVDPSHDPQGALAILQGLPGVANVSLARRVPKEIEALEEAIAQLAADALARNHWSENGTPFRIEASRKDKHYPIPSTELAARLGGAVLARFPQLKVNLTQPQLVLWVEIWDDEAVIFEEKIPGPGGLAVGSSGKVISLLSGGIDSPVASHMLMTRGCPVIFLNFHSFPFIGEQSKEKIIDIVRQLARYQPRSRLYVAPFAAIQEAIRDNCPEGLRTVLYRRMMNRVANRLAVAERALGIVTGESVGQVASQTLENLRAIHDCAEWPVMQPLIGLNKQEITNRAKKIGTYPLSIQPFPDCCTLFQPAKPETRAKLKDVERAESRLDVDELVEACFNGLEKFEFGPEYTPEGW